MTDERRVPAFIPCHPKDIPTVPFCIDSLRGNPQVTEISLIGPAEIEDDCRRLGVGFVDELKLLTPWFPPDTPYGDKRWYYQMLLKFSVAFMPDPPDRYLIIDADTVLLHPFPLIDEATGAVLHPKLDLYVQAYWNGMNELLDRDFGYDGSYTSHMMVYRTKYLRAMLAEFARVKGRAGEDGIEVLKEFLASCDRTTRSLSDYEVYGYYVHEHAPQEMVWADRRQLNVLYVDPSEFVLGRLRPHYAYCSFHAYRRPTNILHRIAGWAWLTLRVNRDRAGSGRRRSDFAA